MRLTPLRARAELVRWQIQRWQVKTLGASLAYHRRARKRVLVLSHDSRISQSQVFPFFLYCDPICRRYDVSLKEIDVEVFEASDKYDQQADIVLLQVWFDFEPDRIRRICDKIHRVARPRRVVFLDGFAHTDIRLAPVLDPYVEVYVKKHLFRNRDEFSKPTAGDTNLTDYFSKRYGLSYPETAWTIPNGFTDKLVLGPGFVTSPELLPQLISPLPEAAEERSIDVHSRLGFKGSDWYEAMRREALATVAKLTDRSVLLTPDVPRKQYIEELKRSKLCYSPFGYGEIAWRDVEAVAHGAILLKPDMSHLELNPSMFIPYETYVPLKWDFSDTVEQMRAYLGDNGERKRLTLQAHGVLRQYLEEARFVEQMQRVFE